MAWDSNLQLAETINTSGTSRVNGTAVDLNTLGNPTGIVQFRMWITSTVTGTSPTLDMRIEESSDNSNFRPITMFPILGTATDANASYASGASHLDCYGVITQRYVRYSYIQTGTSPVYNAVRIWFRGVNGAAGVN